MPLELAGTDRDLYNTPTAIIFLFSLSYFFIPFTPLLPLLILPLVFHLYLSGVSLLVFPCYLISLHFQPPVLPPYLPLLASSPFISPLSLFSSPLDDWQLLVCLSPSLFFFFFWHCASILTTGSPAAICTIMWNPTFQTYLTTYIPFDNRWVKHTLTGSSVS